MISRYNVYLNDISLSSLDDTIYIYDIAYSSVSLERNTNRLAGRQGYYSGSEHIEESRVVVSFSVRQYDTQQRQHSLQEIAKWCVNGGWLKTSDRPYQKMYVRCTKVPTVNSALRWTDTLSVEFTAYDYPFWVDDLPERVSLEADETKSVFVHGTYKTDVEAIVTASAELSGLTIACGETEIELDGLSVPANQEITIRYTDEHHILEIVSGGDSLLGNRTAESSDDLILYPGYRTVSFEAVFAEPEEEETEETEEESEEEEIEEESEETEEEEPTASCTLLIRGVYL